MLRSMLVFVFACCVALPAAAADRFQVVPLQTQTEVIGKERFDSFESVVLDTRTAKASVCFAARKPKKEPGFPFPLACESLPAKVGAIRPAPFHPAPAPLIGRPAGPPAEEVPTSNLAESGHRLVMPALDQALWQVDQDTGDVTLCVLLMVGADGLPAPHLVCSSAKFK